MTKLFVKKLSETAVLPKRGSELAAGWDLAASQSVVVPANGKAIVPTDLAMATPADCYARICRYRAWKGDGRCRATIQPCRGAPGTAPARLRWGEKSPYPSGPPKGPHRGVRL